MSEKLARSLFARAQQFQSELSESGWDESEGKAFNNSKNPQDLFSSEERPLVVGLFGGTGVGKSSLLNRLAGADIARTGVVRPTSMEITAYLHSDIQLDKLPQHFVSDRFSDNRHVVDRFANVMWVDMPDFDSAETENREQVLQWLPHIDLLIYVVTPERYKDAEGWRMMLENGYRHAWLFVLNQWDRAEPVQYKDFIGLLESTGFKAPQVFRTVCVGEHEEDEFSSMLDLIESLASHNVIAHLQERGWIQRLNAVRAGLQIHSKTLGNTGRIGIDASISQRWQELEAASAAHLDAPFKAHSALFEEDKSNAVVTALKSFGSSASDTDIASNIARRTGTNELWDDWLSVRLQDSVNQMRLADDEHGIPNTVLSSIEDIDEKELSGTMTRHFDKAVAAAIDTPGPRWRRFIVALAGWLKILLPVAALLWVTWRVISGFIAGAEDRSAYVGLDFMVNGLLLAGVGWLIPVIIEKILKPSLPDAVYRLLHQGLKDGLDEIQQRTAAEVASVKKTRKRYQTTCQQLEQEIHDFIIAQEKPKNPALEKVLMSASGQITADKE